MHSCSYCQVSRQQEGDGFTISREDLLLACDTIFESTSDTLTVEFQGGDPLIKYDLVKLAIEYITEKQSAQQIYSFCSDYNIASANL